MDNLFITVLNMSLTGTFVILAICLARLPLKKAPKVISYYLWTVAGFRLLVPFSFESMLSLVPFNTSPISPNITTQQLPVFESYIPAIDVAVNASIPATVSTASVNPMQILTSIGGYVWLIGAAAMIIYGIVSYFLLKQKMKSAIHIEGNVYEANFIKSPFVLGVVNPKIYIPNISNEQERDYVILHEQTHIRRYDHIIKFGAYFILCIHWFNPLAWIAFLLMSVDMEMSCDESVLKEVGVDAKKVYSYSLLSFSANRPAFGGSPLSFSEGGLKARVKNVLKQKKTHRLTLIAAIVLTVALGAGLLLNRADNDSENYEYEADPAHETTIRARAYSLALPFGDTDGVFRIRTGSFEEGDNYNTYVAIYAVYPPENIGPTANDRMESELGDLFVYDPELAVWVAEFIDSLEGIYGGVLRFDSVEETNASGVLPFDVIMPSGIPDIFVLDEVFVWASIEPPSRGASLLFSSEVELPGCSNTFGLMVTQSDYGTATADAFQQVYYTTPYERSIFLDGTHLSERLMIGNDRAVLSSFAAIETLQDLRPSEVYGVILSWHSEETRLFHAINTLVIGNADILDFETLIHIAESMSR